MMIKLNVFGATVAMYCNITNVKVLDVLPLILLPVSVRPVKAPMFYLMDLVSIPIAAIIQPDKSVCNVNLDIT